MCSSLPKIETLDQYFEILEKYAKEHPELPDGTPVIPYTCLCEDWKYYCIENAPMFLDGYPNDGCVIVNIDNGADKPQVVDYNTTETAKKCQRMYIHELSPVAGSTHVDKRKGRGHATGNGKTAGRGHKGQKARSGGGVRIGFEGGQMPLARRIPKRGFNNIFAKPLETVNLSALACFEDGAVVDAAALLTSGVLSKCQYGVKILGNGEITKKLTVKAAAFSESAKEKIEAAGGKAEVV